MGKYKKIKTNLEENKDYLICLACLIIFFIAVNIIFAIKCNFYKNELYKAVELRKNDLKTIEYYINENNNLKKRLHEMI